MRATTRSRHRRRLRALVGVEPRAGAGVCRVRPIVEWRFNIPAARLRRGSLRTRAGRGRQAGGDLADAQSATLRLATHPTIGKSAMNTSIAPPHGHVRPNRVPAPAKTLRNALLVLGVFAAATANGQTQELQLRYLGAAGWEMRSGNLVVLVDPVHLPDRLRRRTGRQRQTAFFGVGLSGFRYRSHRQGHHQRRISSWSITPTLTIFWTSRISPRRRARKSSAQRPRPTS